MKPYASYKPSGVLWLGDVPAPWAVERLRFRVKVNPSFSKPLSADLSVSFLPMEAIGDDGALDLERTRLVGDVASGYTYFEDGDVAIAKITPCYENGKGAVMAGLVEGVGFGTTELIVMRPIQDDCPRWLYYLTMCSAFRLPGEALMQGAGGQKRVPDLFVKDYFAPIPPPDEQQAIADYLDVETARIDTLIHEKDELIGLLREAQASAFATTVLRFANATVGVNCNRFTWLQSLPANWRVAKVKHITLSVDQGISPQCESRPPEDGEWGVLKVGCVNTGHFNPMESKALPSDIEPIESITLLKGDVLISRANTKNLVGRAAMADKDYPRLMLSDKHYRLRLDQNECLSQYLVFVLTHGAVRVHIEERATGASASMLNIDRRTIMDLDVPLPPLDVQGEIVREVQRDRAALGGLIAHTHDEIGLLKELRASTIADAVLGRIDVRGRAKTIAACD